MRKAGSIAVLLGVLAFGAVWVTWVGSGPASGAAAPEGIAQSLNCPDDDREENDSLAAAEPIAIPGYYADLRVCTGDQDFYAFQLGLNDEVRIHAFFIDSRGDIDIGLRDPDGDTVATSTTDDDNEEIVYTAETAGTHYLLVSLFSEADQLDGNTYDIQVNVTGTCADDVFEDNDTQPTALLGSTPVYLSNLRICPLDLDWFSVPLLAGAEVQVDTFFDHAEGNISISLFDSEGGFLAASTTFDDDEKFVYEVTETAFYGVLVILELPDTGVAVGNTYDLQIGQPDAFVPCPEDTYEDNDLFPGASAVSLPFYEPALRACPTDADFFAFEVSTGDEVEISVIVDGAEGPIASGAFSSDDVGDLITGSNVVFDNGGGTVKFTAESTGTYYVFFVLNEELGTAPGASYKVIIVGAKPPTATPSATPTPTATPPEDADLVVKSIDISIPKPETEETFDITVVVSNQGAAAAGSFFVDFYGDLPGPPDPGEEGDFFCEFGGLAPGASVECDASGSFSNPGSYDMWAQVDTDEAVDESNEGNNIFGPQKLDVNEPGAPTSTPTSTFTPTSTPTFTPTSTSTPTTPPTDTPPPTATDTPPAAGILGDVDCNQFVTAIDAALLLQFGAGLFPSLACGENADVNLDGSSNSIDVALILQLIAGLLSNLPP